MGIDAQTTPDDGAAVRCAVVSAPFSGMEVWLRGLVEALDERDDVQMTDGIWMTRPPQERLGRVPPLSLHWWLSSWWSTTCGLRALRRRGSAPEVVLMNHVNPVVLVGSTRWRSPIVLELDATPSIITGMSQHYLGRGARPAWIERLKVPVYRFIYRRAEHIVAFSELVRRSLVDEYGVPAARVTVIRNGIDSAAWQAPARDADAPVRVLFVGGDFERKGGADVLTAARMLAPEGIAFDVVTAAEPADVPANVTVHTGVGAGTDRLLGLFHDASMFVLPTYADFSPNVIGEAMAMGLPVVASDVGAISEMVSDADTGYLIAPGDVDALVERIRQLAGAPALRAAMARNARSLAETSFDIRHNAAAYATVLTRARRRRG